MSVPVVKFNLQDQPEFIKELRKRVNRHFKEKNVSKYANTSMKLKTIFMLCLYFVPFSFILTGVVSTLWPMMAMWVLMGLGMSGIGLSIMHDANHGSYSKNNKVNNALGYLVNFLGAYHVNWKIQHNVLHHSFTNIEGLDEDIYKPIMRFSPNQKPRKIFRFQAFYALFFYGLMMTYWFIWKDFDKLFKYKKLNLLAGQGVTFRRALTQVIVNKTWYLSITVILPILIIDLPWWNIVLGFLLMQFICGLLLALIFQPAHVIEETEFYTPVDQGTMENNWAIHQLRTTANFANGSKLFSWLVGGLNFQIEHHLFPNICHIHYRNLSAIVKQTALEFDIPYHQHRTFYDALKSHFSLLNQLGTGSYDKKMARATANVA